MPDINFPFIVKIAGEILIALIWIFSAFTLFILNRHGEKQHFTIALSVVFILALFSLTSLAMSHLMALGAN